MIPQEDNQDTDPLTLLPSVLQHLPNLLDNPSLASTVFGAIRKASHNSKAHVFINPLLAPITAAALTASSTQLRLDAANTCAALVRALIHRRAISAANAYIDDLIQLAHQIAQHYGPDPPKCILRRFTKISATVPISSPIAEKLKPFNFTVQHLSLTSHSLEGILQLFATLIPSHHQLPTKLFCRHVTSVVEPIEPQAASTSHLLWIGIGSRARAAIFTLAASRPLLSMNCGIRVALMAASVLERSLDPGCGCLVPISNAQSLIAKVETILIETTCFPPSRKLHVDVRLALYKLALLASSSGSLTPSLWGTCGIIEAATNIGELGHMLRSLSRNGRVACRELNYSSDLKQILDGLGPPSKRRRITSQTPASILNEGDSATPSSQNQHSSIESDEPHMQQMNGPVAALQQCLADAGNIYLFTTNPELMKMFAHAFLLTADTFKSINQTSAISVRELEKWLSFVLSISKMVNDLTPSLNASASTDSWKATFDLAKACSDLYVSLGKIDSAHHTDEKVTKAFQSVSLSQIRSYLLTSISSIITLAYNAGKSSDSDIPIEALSDLLWYIGELALTSESPFSESEELRKVCEDLQKATLEKRITNDIRSRVLLFRGSTHACLSCKKNDLSGSYKSQFPDIQQLFSESDNDETISAVIQAMSDSICIEAGCHNKHFRSRRDSGVRSQHSERTTNELVYELFRLISPMVEADCSTMTRGQAINCIGVISLHGSKELAEQCGIILVKAIWHADYQNRLKAHFCLSELLTSWGEEISLKSETSSFETDGQKLSLDDPWECFRDLMKLHEGNLALSKLAEVLHVELVLNYERMVGKGSSRWTSNTVDRDNSFSCALITILFIDGLVPLALGAFSFGQLLLAAVEDLEYISSKNDSEGADDEVVTNETSISLPALNRLLTTIKQLTTSSRSTTRSFNFPNEDPSIENIMFSSSDKSSSSGTNNTFPTSIGTFILLHMHDWLPFLLESILKKPSLANHLACMITNGDVPLFWMKVARVSVGPTLCSGDVSTINHLSQQANFELHGLVEKIWPDVLARALMMDPAFVATKHGIGYRFLTDILHQPLETIVATRCGKVVQRLVMELAGRKAHRAERALNSIGKLIAHSSDGYSTSENFAGELLSTHFMLVMDAVNRGLFHSRATAKEKMHHLRILRRVIVLASQKLHLFIPKVLATLRLSLDSMKEKDVKQEIMSVWVSFIKTLGPKNCRSQLASVLAILVPILHDYESLLEEPLRSMIEYIAQSQYGDEEEIIVLLQVGRSHICQDLASIVEKSILIKGLDAEDRLQGLRGNEQGSGLDFFTTCQIICKVISKHSNGSIEILTAKYLLRLLQKNRKQIETLRSQAILVDGQEPSRNTVAPLLREIVELTNKNRNTDCRITLMQCIGEIGSFHPSFVLSHQSEDDQKNNKIIDKTRREYPANKYAISAFLLDDHLVPILIHGEKQHVASTHVNRIGLVIQELLRACGCSKDIVSRAGLSKHSSGEPKTIDWRTINLQETVDGKALYFWERLKSSTREAIFPYLSEPFDVRLYSGVFGGDIAGDSIAACDRVWQKVKDTSGSRHAPSAMEWIRQIVVQLVDFIGKRGPFGKVYRALRPLLRYEAAVAEFVLPIVIRTALDLQYMEEKDDISQFVCTELSEVLQEASSVQPVFDLLDVLRHWRETDCYLIGRRSALERLGIAPGSGVSDNPRGNWSNAQAESFKRRDPLSCLVDLEGGVDKKLSILTLSKSAFRARSFHRAVMFAEQHIRNLRRQRNNGGWPSYIENLVGKISSGQSGNAQEEGEALGVLQQSFAQLEKTDSMCGVAALRANSTVEESILDEEAAGRFDSALTTYERAISRSPRNEDFHRGFLGCLMTLGHWETMLSHSEGLLASVKITEDKLRLTAETHGIEAAWRLGRWEKLEELTDQSIGNDRYQLDEKSEVSWMADFNVSFGKMLLSMRARDSLAVDLAAHEARRHLEIPLARAAREGYGRAYPLITLLHSISDVEDVAGMLKKSPAIAMEGETAQVDGNNLLSTLIMLKGRETIVSKSMRIRERILSTKRLCFEYLNMPDEAAKSSLQLAGLASESDNLRAASASAFRALSTRNVGEVVAYECAMEMAKICWKQGDSTGALGMIKKEIDRLRSGLPKVDRRRRNNLHASEASDRLCTAYVVAAEWMEETRGEPSDVILHYLDNAAEFGPHREEPFYALGRHYDSLLQANSNTDSKLAPAADLTSSRPSRRNIASSSSTGLQHDHTKYVPLVIKSFSKALCNGHSRIYEAVPRMLTVWFDFYTLVTDPNYTGDGLALEEEVKNEMKGAFETVPLYMWAAAVPQLMSRLLHSHKGVREELNHLLARIVCEFTDYSVWTILPSSQLRTMERKRAASDVLNYSIQLQRKSKSNDAKERSRALRSRIQKALLVVQHLVDICLTTPNKDRRGKKDNFANEFKDLRTHLRGSASLNPIMPTLDSLTVRLPIGNETPHIPFDIEPIRISNIDNMAMVMPSLMRPRRISLVGSDGNYYKYLAKKETHGDMRKDSRLVEFITVVNRLISKDSTTRGRKLELKTYSVLPLSEETGLIEWVDNVTPLRNIVKEEHEHLINIPTVNTIQSRYQSVDHRRFLEEWAFPKHPVVLDRFFIKRFGGGADAQRWIECRDLWTQSTAVWSMAGYVIGLGDRHGENILIETTTGRCVHVDFAMLFDKGLKLKFPEIVPFRLTRNMVTAMGIAGYEGEYRKCCERVIELMRMNLNTLLGVLESFLHDPMADWTRGDINSLRGGSNRSTNKEALQARMVVKAKLTGLVDTSGLPLSIHGQVQRLIYEATNIDNLSEMFLWWSAWI